MPDTVRIGVIGTSWYTDFMHLPALASHPRAQIHAICGRTHGRAAEIAQKYAIPNVYTDYQTMIEQAELDAVIVATPDDLHYPMVMHALDVGLHVLCEKPLALRAAEAREMYEKADAAHVKHMVFYTYRWLPPVRLLREQIAQGALGQCFHGQFQYLAGYGIDGAYGWRFDQQRANGILGDLGSHMIDLARWTIGDISRVSAHLATHVARAGVAGAALEPANDAALLTVEFQNGAHGIIQVSAVANVGEQVQQQRFELHGTAGMLQVDMSFVSGVVRSFRQGEAVAQELVVPEGLWGDVDRGADYLRQLLAPFRSQSVGTRLFIDAILDDLPITPNFYDGWKAQQVIEAAMVSHREQRWVTIE
jgi:predicted dehydrogenase